jgi:hypothetical protein
MFDINNSKDFYAKLVADFDDYMQNLDSARHAVNCAITAYHVHDWVWNDFLKGDSATRAKMGIGKKKASFVNWIIAHSPWFGMVSEIANGSKHFGRKAPFRIPLVNDYVEEGYVEPGYFESYFAIDQVKNAKPRYMPVSSLFDVALRFWRDFFTNYSPYTNLPKGKVKLSDEQ